MSESKVESAPDAVADETANTPEAAPDSAPEAAPVVSGPTPEAIKNATHASISQKLREVWFELVTGAEDDAKKVHEWLEAEFAKI